jgi:hypothetical protein
MAKIAFLKKEEEEEEEDDSYLYLNDKRSIIGRW